MEQQNPKNKGFDPVEVTENVARCSPLFPDDPEIWFWVGIVRICQFLDRADKSTQTIWPNSMKLIHATEPAPPAGEARLVSSWASSPSGFAPKAVLMPMPKVGMSKLSRIDTPFRRHDDEGLELVTHESSYISRL